MNERASKRCYSSEELENKCTPVMIVNLVLEHHFETHCLSTTAHALLLAACTDCSLSIA